MVFNLMLDDKWRDTEFIGQIVDFFVIDDLASDLLSEAI